MQGRLGYNGGNKEYVVGVGVCPHIHTSKCTIHKTTSCESNKEGIATEQRKPEEALVRQCSGVAMPGQQDQMQNLFCRGSSFEEWIFVLNPQKENRAKSKLTLADQG